MPEFLPYLIRIAIALLPVGILFGFYARHFVFSRDFIWQSKIFFIGWIASALALASQWFLPDANNHFVRAFFHAAFVEEAARALVLYIRIKRSSDSFSVTEGIFDGVLLGLGFSFAENLHYSVRYSGYVILLRCVSSVPMHVFCSGVMGYFFSYRALVEERRPIHRRLNWFGARTFVLLGSAFVIPLLLHGFYDLSLFHGGNWNYVVPILLIGGFSGLEYLIAEGRGVPAKNVLEVLGLDADDMDIIQRQKDCDKWVMDAQEVYDEPMPLFVNRWTPFNTIAGGALTGFALVMAALRGWFLHRILPDLDMSPENEIALIFLLPITIGLIFLVSDKINYLYFREYVARLPGGILIQVERQSGETFDTIVMDILPRGVFISGGADFLALGEKITVRFQVGGGRTVPMQGIVKWANTMNLALPMGVIFQFLKPGPGFLLFRMRFKGWKIRRIVVLGIANMITSRR